MIPNLGMPQGGEWLVILAVVLLLFGSAKLPALVRQLARSKKVWEKEVVPRRQEAKAFAAEVKSTLTIDSATANLTGSEETRTQE